MPRGKRNVDRTRRIIQKILDGKLLWKQIAFEEEATVQYISAIASRYTTFKPIRILNSDGERLMNPEEQLNLNLGDPNA